MFARRLPKVFRRHVQVNLRAAQLAVAKQIADRHEVHTRTHQMRRERMPKLVRRELRVHFAQTTVSSHPLVDRVARQRLVRSA